MKTSRDSLSRREILLNLESLEDFIARIEKLKVLLRDPTFVSMNLVSIPTEAGFAECNRTVRYLESMKIPIQHIVVNQIIPPLAEVWADAETNPAVALLKPSLIFNNLPTKV